MATQDATAQSLYGITTMPAFSNKIKPSQLKVENKYWYF